MTFGALQELDLSAARIGAHGARRPTAGRRRGVAHARDHRHAQSTSGVADRCWRRRSRSPRSAGGRSPRRSVTARSSPGRRTPTSPSWPSSRARWRRSRPPTRPSSSSPCGPSSTPARTGSTPGRRRWPAASSTPCAPPGDAAPTSAATAASSGCARRRRPDSAGYVTGPSLAHAATAGVLRSAHLANAVAGTDRLDVDLSSARVRARPRADAWRPRGHAADGAARLPPRAGPARGRRGAVHPPAAHDVPDPRRARSRAGRAARGDAAARRRRRDVAARRVDAPERDLLRAAARRSPGPPDMAVDDPRMATLDAQLETLADVFDAIGDLVLAEAVHQTVAGRPERAQAATRFLDRQEVPVEPDVSATPRRADSFVHRYAVAIGPPALSAAWRALAADDARSTAEPRVDSWVAQLLGEPSRGRSADGPSATDGDAGPIEVVTPADLGLGPLALVAAAVTGGGEHASELEQRVAGVDRRPPRRRGRASSCWRPRPTGSGWPSSWRSPAPSPACCGPPAPATPGRSTCPTARRPPPSTSPSSRRGRRAAEQRLRDATLALDAAIDAPTPTVGAVRDAIDGVSRAGVPGAVPPIGDAARRARRRRAAGGDRRRGGRRPPPPTPVSPSSTRSAPATPRRRPAGGSPSCSARRSRSSASSTCRTASRASLDDRGPVDAHRRRPAGRRDVADPDVQGPPRARRAVAPPRRRRGDDRRLHGDRAHRRAAARPRRRPVGGAAVRVRRPAPGRRRRGDRRPHAGPRPAGGIGRRARRRLVDRADPRRRGDRRDRPAVRRPVEPGAAGGAARRPARRGGDRPWSVDALLSVIGQSLDMAHARGVTLDELPAAGSVLPALYVPFDLGDDVPSVDLDRLASPPLGSARS